MAIRSSPHTMFPRGQTSRTGNRDSTLCKSQIQPSRTAAALIKPCTAKKAISLPMNPIFEDQVMGIVCYQDEHGEVICEGLDEGPRYSRQASPYVHQESMQRHRDILIVDSPPHRRYETNTGPSVLCLNGFAAQEQERQ